MHPVLTRPPVIMRRAAARVRLVSMSGSNQHGVAAPRSVSSHGHAGADALSASSRLMSTHLGDTPLVTRATTCGHLVARVAARRGVGAERYPLATPTPLPRWDWGVHAEQHCL
jgi:hypothetical protein